MPTPTPPPEPALSPDRLARLAHLALLDELRTHPKPGLVSHRDGGSHTDMDGTTFRRSAAALHPFFRRLAAAGSRPAPMDELRRIGLEAEAAMNRATGGVNTHRGAIFGLGLLCAAAAAARPSGEPLGTAVARRWGDDIASHPLRPADRHSHGAEAFRRFGAGGARAEAAAGFPSVYRVGLPAFLAARRAAPHDPEAARVQTLFALLAQVHDTNLLHRGGRAGADWARREARRFLDRGGIAQPDWRDHARHCHHAFAERALSPGGCADLLAMTLFVFAVGEPGAARA